MPKPLKRWSNYFSHDSNARNSDKLINVRMRHGAEGYGIFFMILERLREENDYMSVTDYNAVAFDLRVDASKVKSIVEDFGLFVFTADGEYFYSESFNARMEIMDKKSKSRSEAGKKGAVARWGEADDEWGGLSTNGIAIATNGKAIAMPSKKMANKLNNNKLNKTKLNNNKTKTKTLSYSDNCALNNAILDFIEFRKKIKATMTDRAISLMLSKLDREAKDDEEKIAMLEQSIMNGWKSVYPVKVQGQGQGKREVEKEVERFGADYFEGYDEDYVKNKNDG